MTNIILLADDDQDDAELFCEALAEVYPSIVCYCVSDGNEILERLEMVDNKEPDIIFLDVNMPGMNGWQCISNLKKSSAYEHIPVVMYSTSSNKKDIEISSQLGALCFFTKPSDFKKLRTYIKLIVSHVNGEIYNAPEVMDGIRFNKVLPSPEQK